MTDDSDESDESDESDDSIDSDDSVTVEVCSNRNSQNLLMSPNPFYFLKSW